MSFRWFTGLLLSTGLAALRSHPCICCLFLQQVIHPAAQLIVVFGQRAWTSKRRSQIWYNEMTYGGLDSKESTCSARDPDSIPGSGRSPGGGDGHPLQYSCLENPMDRRAWWASVPGVTESDATEGLTLSLCAAPTT